MANHEKILDHVPRALMEYESWKETFKVQIRPSMLPFCQIQYLFSKLDPIQVSAGDSFIERIFVGIGSTTHDVIQTYLGRAGLMYGSWQCKKCFWSCSPILGTPYCGDKRLVWTRGKGLNEEPIGPEEKPCCYGYATRYVEFSLLDPVSGLKGHTDGLIIIGGQLYLLEVKTKATSAIVAKLIQPDDNHIAQATTYAEMCTPEKWGLDQEVVGVAFCYVPRDYPNRMRFLFHGRDATTLENVRKEVPEAKQILKTGRGIANARAVCPTKKYAEKIKYCQYAAQCFRPDRTEYIKKLWIQRVEEQRIAKAKAMEDNVAEMETKEDGSDKQNSS